MVLKGKKRIIKSAETMDEMWAILKSHLENSTDSIWSVDNKLQIKTLNSIFKQNYKAAYGVDLIEGVSVVTSLPEPLRSIWLERYNKALKGEKYSIIDVFNFEDSPMYVETFFNPIIVGEKNIGVSCLGRDISLQKLAEEKFNKLFENTHSSVSVHTKEKFLLVNKAWEKLSGYTQKDLETLIPMDLIHPDSRAKFSKFHGERVSGEKVPNNYIMHLRRKDGKEKWLDVSVTLIDYLGKNATLVIGNDVTDFHKMQKTILRNEANLNALVENTNARIWSIDSQLKFVFVNPNFKKDYKNAFNISIKNGMYALVNVPENTAEVWKKRYRRALNGEKFTVVDEFQYKNVPQYTETAFNPIFIDKQILGVSCFSRDISQQKRAEKFQNENEIRLKTLVANIPSVSYRCRLDIDWTMEFISEEIKTLSGYPPVDFIQNKVRSFDSLIFPDDKPLVREQVLEAIKNKENYELTYRVVDSSNSIHWVRERGRAIYEENGEVKWLDGVISDITEQKNTEDSLIESEMRYRTIFNSMTDIYIRVDLEGYIQFITPSVEDVFGYKPDKIIGTSLVSLYAKKGERDKLIGKILENEFVRDFEVEILAKDGDKKTIALNASVIKDESGEPIAIDGIARDITLRKIAEQSLQERTKELNTIFDNAPVVLLLVDEDGKVLNINRSATRFQNTATSTIMNNLGSEILGCINSYKNKNGCGKTEDCSNCIIRQTLHDTFNKKIDHSQVEGTIYITEDGLKKNRHFLISTSYIGTEKKNRVLISLDDITDIKEAQVEIKKLSSAVEHSMATIVITDIDGNITYANPQFEKSTGYSVKDAIGKNPRILKSENKTSADYEHLWQTILKGETWNGEFLNLRKDGSEYWERAIISPIFDDSGEITNFIAVKEDITERKQIEEELIRSEKELRQSNTERSKFISILAHDLRGLVGSFHAYSDLLYSQFDAFSPDELKEQILTLSNSSGDSLKLLDNLLEWGKLSQGKITKLNKTLSLKEETDTLIKLLSEFSNSKGVHLVNASATDLEIFSDPNILQTVIRNLVYNAIKFTPSGGYVSINFVEINTNRVEISVEDTGIGMDESIRSKLFKTGEKVVREGTNHEPGSGLGLLICDEMVKQLGGQIQVKSEVGKGSRFFFDIPVCPSEE